MLHSELLDPCGMLAGEGEVEKFKQSNLIPKQELCYTA